MFEIRYPVVVIFKSHSLGRMNKYPLTILKKYWSLQIYLRWQNFESYISITHLAAYRTDGLGRTLSLVCAAMFNRFLIILG